MNAIPRAIAAGAAIGLLSLVVPTEATAAAQRGQANVNVTINLSPDTKRLMGKVKSPRNACERHRNVKLWWKEDSESAWQHVATDESNNAGEWRVPAPGEVIPNGKYYVKIASNSNCQSAKSETITVALDIG